MSSGDYQTFSNKKMKITLCPVEPTPYPNRDQISRTLSTAQKFKNGKFNKELSARKLPQPTSANDDTLLVKASTKGGAIDKTFD